MQLDDHAVVVLERHGAAQTVGVADDHRRDAGANERLLNQGVEVGGENNADVAATYERGNGFMGGLRELLTFLTFVLSRLEVGAQNLASGGWRRA